MRAILFGTVIFGLWVGFGAPVPGLRLEPLKPNPDLPTFEEAVANSELEKAAVESGQIPQDPERRKLRNAVLRAAAQLEVSPCNLNLQQRLVAAAIQFIESTEEGTPEMGVVNGKERNLSGRFDAQANQAIHNALFDGLIDPKELGGRWRGFPISDQMRASRREALCFE